MQNITLESVKDCEMIFSNKSHVLIVGKYLWLFRTDGSYLRKIPNIRRPSKVAFLPGNRALVDGEGDGFYHYIALDTGEILWSSTKKGRRACSAYRFAVSQDGSIVYDVCYSNYHTIQVDQIYPLEQKHYRYSVSDGLRVTSDIYCDSANVLCLAQTELVINANDPYSINSAQSRKNGILAIPILETGPCPYWKRQWSVEQNEHVSIRGGNDDYWLFGDFSVLNLETMEKFDLLQNNRCKSIPKDNFSWNYDSERKLLTVWYIGKNQNIVIDCQKRQVIASYFRDSSIYGYGGCLIDNEYWMGTPHGIVRKPFPHIEEN